MTSFRPNPLKRLPDLDSLSAYLYAPVLPYLKRIKVTRTGPRGHNPKDILLHEGYVAEVVVTGFNAPVHCTFNHQGFCYVSEADRPARSEPCRPSAPR